jgi:hypothetical protein
MRQARTTLAHQAVAVHQLHLSMALAHWHLTA